MPTDLIRDEQGKFRVLKDNVRVPGGVSYVLENRLAMTRLFPALFSDQKIHHVDEYPSRLLTTLRAAAPHGVVDQFVVVLTPGVHNAAYFEHTLLARLMGVELVEGRNLVLKPAGGAGGAGIVIGPKTTEAELQALKATVRADPRGWMAQKPIALSASPVLVGEKLAPRHIDLRPFAVNDGRRLGAARRPHPRGPGGGRARGELRPGRRVEGHLGPRPGPRTGNGGRSQGTPGHGPA